MPLQIVGAGAVVITAPPLTNEHLSALRSVLGGLVRPQSTLTSTLVLAPFPVARKLLALVCPQVLTEGGLRSEAFRAMGHGAEKFTVWGRHCQEVLVGGRK